MQSIESRRSCALAVTALLAAVLVVLAHGDAQGSAVPAGPSPAEGPASIQTPQALAESAIVSSNLVARLEAALGDGFAGEWFEPATGRLHVGYTSAATRRRIDGVAARAGLAGLVQEVPVESTWAQLEAAHERWDRRLDDLFDRSAVATALSPSQNSVTIEVGSRVSATRRDALERNALADDVNVAVAVSPYAELDVEPQGRCAAFAPGKAACNPTIVGGMTIEGPIVNASEIEEGEIEEEEDYEEEDFVEVGEGKLVKRCTAGPAVKVKDPADNATATKTYILTAGHCVDPNRGGGGVGAKWNAFNKVPEAKEIGATITFIHNLMDIGVIEVTTNYWAEAKNPPVIPTIAPWAKAETEPYPVIQQNNPAVGMNSCLSGQTTGISCGKIITLDQTTTVRGVKKTNLAEVEKAKSAGGDSGGPWFAESEYNKGTGFVEGTHVGRKNKTGNPVFQPLSVTLPELKKQKNLDLELLTTKNEKRHNPVFWSESSPVTVDGEQTATFILKRTGRTVECKKATLSATAESGAETVSVTPTYTECKSSLGGPATIKMNSCSFLFHIKAEAVGEADTFTALTDFKCPEGKEIEVDVFTSEASHASGTVACRYKIGESGNQSLTTVDLTNKAGSEGSKDWIEADVVLGGIDSKRTVGTTLLCGAESDTAGTLEGSAALKGTTEKGAANGIKARTS
jgi:hypothetical protein